MASKLESLRSMSTVVSDTGDMEFDQEVQTDGFDHQSDADPEGLAAAGLRHLVDEAVSWGQKRNAPAHAVTDRLAVNFGTELTKIVPGRVSTEVDADLSFDTAGQIAKAKALIADYESRGVGREHILIKLAATWEGAQAAAVLQRERIDCNMTLIFSLAQAIACADSKAFLISPFVGRILDWHVKAGGGPYTTETDPGVVSVHTIYAYYKSYGIGTVVMGASFRNVGEIDALAGCDRLTISPQLLAELDKEEGELVRRLDPKSPGKPPERIELDEKKLSLDAQRGCDGDGEAERRHSQFRQGSRFVARTRDASAGESGVSEHHV